MKARKARKKRKLSKRQRHEGTKARRHEGTKAGQTRDLARTALKPVLSFQYLLCY